MLKKVIKKDSFLIVECFFDESGDMQNIYKIYNKENNEIDSFGFLINNFFVGVTRRFMLKASPFFEATITTFNNQQHHGIDIIFKS